MKCPRCGNIIPDGVNKCSQCGLMIIDSSHNNIDNKKAEEIINLNNNNQVNNTNNNIEQNDNIKQNNDTFQNDIVNLEGYFVGKNYDKLKKRKLSFNTLIFGFAYTLYRKLILISLFWIAIDIASVVIMKKYSIFVILGLNIIMSFLFRHIYFAIANNKVDNIKRKYWGHSVDELKYRVSKKGGTSGLAIFFLGFSVVVACIVSVLLYVVYYPQYYVDKFFFRVPSDFDSFANDVEGKSSFMYSDNVNYCSIVASKEEDYKSAEDYINDRFKNDESNITKEKKSLWGNDWNFITVYNSDNSKAYYYVIEKDGVVYNYEFNIYNGFGRKCEKYHDYVKYSMTIR